MPAPTANYDAQIKQLNTRLNDEHKNVESHRAAIKKLEDRVQHLEKAVRDLQGAVNKLSHAPKRPV